ncbi:MAG: efflux RND transporter permease subunit, partial [Bacteroidetes bacterium]|nr:efflux RND transporter permease subunit [Bacteroidota bacterium]
MLKIFIDRPVLSTVISIVIVIMGLVALTSLPVQQFPDIAPPTVEVRANYPGANADVVLNSVIAPLEEKINGVEGMTYMVSSANNDGSATIQVFFTLETDPDMAAVNVQNRVASATSSLPAVVNQMGVSTAKKQNSMVLVLSVASNNADYDETFVQNYTRIYILPELQRVDGVGDVKVFGARDFSMRVWLHPEKLAAFKLQPTDVMQAIKEQSLEVAPGKIGANSTEAFQLTIKYKGRLTEVSEYENIVLRVSNTGEILYLRDVATIEFGAFNYDIIGRTNGKPSVVMAVYQMKGSNSQYISTEIKARLKGLEANLPSGMHFDLVVDSQDFLDASIHEVVKTLIEAFILVFLVVFVFLQNVRATIIPAISVLVALVGTFMFLQVFGFSINMLTLFALVLSIGIVVDDAIVVVEAVYAKLEADSNITPLEATKSAMGDITGAVISITLVFVATFLPALMMTGATGAFYQQFCVTLAVAVTISAVNALTLSPALCAIMIKVNHEGEGKKEKEKRKNLLKRMGNGFNVGFNVMVQKYGNLLQKFMSRKVLVLIAFILIASFSVFLLMRTPTAFVPTEDQGVVFFDVAMPEGTSLDRTQNVLAQLDTLLHTIPEVDLVVTVGGSGMLSGAVGGSYGLGFVKLAHWSQRDTIALKDIVMQMYGLAAKHVTKDATVLFFVPPTISGYGSSSDIEMQFLDQSGSGDIMNMYRVGQEFMNKMNERPEISKTFCSFTVNVPQFELELDVNKAKMMGVSPLDVFNTMQYYYGGGVAG